VPTRKTILERTRTLSELQRRVAAMAADGFKNREIAAEIGIGVHVVRNYLTLIYDKIGVNNRVELALWYEAREHESRLRK
jgi:DNA-binding CsgD family transcriptional regulator